MRHSLTLAVMLALAGGPAWAENAQEGIEASNKRFEAAFNQGDAAGVAQCYTSDAALLPPGEARVEGRAAIQQYWKGAIDAGFRQLTLKAVEVAEGKDMAVEVGSWSIVGPDAKGVEQPASGKYLVLWHHASEGWQLHRDMWNDDPAAK